MLMIYSLFGRASLEVQHRSQRACDFSENLTIWHGIGKKRKGKTLADSFSEPLVALLEGLLATSPADRFTLGKESNYSSVLTW